MPYSSRIDFTAAASIPGDPKARLPFFNACRELVRREREKIRDWHRAGGGGREIIQAQTCLIDGLIKHLVNILSSLPEYTGAPLLSEFALAAVGGYGRGELNPHSDIDLLFVLPKKIDPRADKFIQDLLSVLWGIGLEIGHSCRQVKDCLALAKEDLTVQTSMIDMRLLIGDPLLFEELSRSLKKGMATKNLHKLLQEKLTAPNGASLSELVCVPEPDIKNGPGGLRYYHAVLWAVAAQFGSISLLEMAGGSGAFSEKELKNFNRAVDFFLRVRNELHYLAGKKHDLLKLQMQENLAANLGFRGAAGAGAAGEFMREYFLHALTICHFSEIVYKRCLREDSQSIGKTINSFIKRKDLGNGFYALDATLYFDGDIARHFTEQKEVPLELFDLCRLYGLSLDTQLKRQIRLHEHLLDDAFLRGKKVRDFLFALLSHPHSEINLRLMHEVGILGKILPEFGQTFCLVRYDFYHRYTADEHALRMVRFLEYLEASQEKDLEEFAGLYRAAPHKILLKLASLLHSLGRGAEGGEDARRDNGEDLGRVAARLLLAPEELELLRFLLEHLYTLIETAFHREIHDVSTIKELAAKTGGAERLRLLYLLSYAELKAVAPETLTPWKRFLLAELYKHALAYFSDPQAFEKKALGYRFDIFNRLQGEFFWWEIEQHLNQLTEDYWTSTPPESVARHIHLVRALESRPFSLLTAYNEERACWHLTLCWKGRSEAFQSLVGILTAKSFSIMAAQIFPMQDGGAITTLQVETMRKEINVDAPVWREVEGDLHSVLTRKKNLRDLLLARKRYAGGAAPAGPIIPKVQVDLTASPEFTLIRVEARDHLGMLYKIIKTLSDFDIQIHRAKIACQGNRGIDVFYVTQRGGKIVFQGLLRQVKERLLQAMMTENIEDLCHYST